MKIHYQTKNGEEKFLDNVIHLQNVDNEHLIVTFANGNEITLNICGLEGVFDPSVVER